MLRLIAALAFPVPPAGGDAVAYDQLGFSLAGGHGFTLNTQPDSKWAPAYPVIVAAVYAVAGRHPGAVYVVQALLDVGACLVLWWWTRRRAGETVALITLALSAISLSAIAAVRIERTESMAAWLLIAGMALIDLSRDVARDSAFASNSAASPFARKFFLPLGGVVLGILTLSRWQFSLFPLFVAALLLVDRGGGRGGWRRALILIGAYALTLAPWIARNQIALGAPVLSTQTGVTLYMSHFRNPGQPWGVNTSDANTAAASAMTPLDGNRYLVHETVRRLSEHPSIVLRAYPEKLFYLLVPLDWEELRDRRTVNLTYFVFALLALLGARACFMLDRRWLMMLVLPLVYLAVMALPFYGSPRFRLPVEPLLLPIAALGLTRFLNRSRDPALAEVKA